VVLDVLEAAMSPLASVAAAVAALVGAVVAVVLLHWMYRSLWHMVGAAQFAPALAFAVLTGAGWTLAVADPAVEWTPRLLLANTAELVYDQTRQWIGAESLKREYRGTIRDRIAQRSGA